jgi:hypothetical protein
MQQHLWKDEALCLGSDTTIFFDAYEDQEDTRQFVDSLCRMCPVAKKCFAVGISGKEWGVWGGIYLENGEISKEFNKHKAKKDWSYTWQMLTMDR